MKKITNEPDWNYQENIAIHPCPCNAECGQYVLYIKTGKAHIKFADQGMIDVASLDISDLYDLLANVYLILSVEDKRDELEKTYRKKQFIDYSKKRGKDE